MATHTATLKYLRITPRKVRSVARLLKGLPLPEAEAQLIYERRRAAKPLLKLLRSAAAGAKHARNVDEATLYIQSIRVDKGLILRRHLPRARGMATPIEKKSSHVTLFLDILPEGTKPRFTILREKKVKLPPEERKKERKKGTTVAKEEARASKAERPGFFKRMFRRKAGM
jgi:large subunit ribosomal protein L22